MPANNAVSRNEGASNAPLRTMYISFCMIHMCPWQTFLRVDDSSQTHLQVAIVETSEKRLKAILVELSKKNSAVGIALFEHLVTCPGQRRHSADEQQEETPKFAPRWRVGENCKEEFDAGKERNEGECAYHEGDLEVNEDMFLDWDERCHGPMDTEENEKQFPENFTYNCCDKDGTSKGCVLDVHVPFSPKKRARYA
ncbi:hypothetical protein K474DRAFT_1659959 [Panus rudis PR-1116 ss-1]|nr:hypothetical protein K474DRAFT_1659959 [Panus rudis PR-1116 ss-1]